MSKFFRILIVLSAVVALPVMAETTGAVTEYGYYQVASEPERYRNIASTSGYVKEGGEVTLVEQTQRIPLEKNRLFGFKFRISGFEGKKSVQLKLVVTHPEITRPNGSMATGYSYPILLEVKDGVIENQTGYSLDHEYELVEGDWTFEFWYYNQKLVSQTFTTYKNDEPSSTGASESNADPGADQVKPAIDAGEKG
ncbi:DUF3859 domain-containing protein [Kaarinaea lacus]